jgi:hypothetical protein
MTIRNPGRWWILVKEAAPAGPNVYHEIEGEAMIRVSQKRHPASALMGPR